MKAKNAQRILTFLIALVWLLNGLVCKVLNVVPRHEQIVSRILGAEHARTFTLLIGTAEIIMTLWILSRFQSKLNAITQIVVVATMNSLEFILVPDLLLWGRFNSLFALLFISFVYYNEFVLNKKLNGQNVR
ncbi:MAG: DoxX-like family protein [Fluviicola sp.]